MGQGGNNTRILNNNTGYNMTCRGVGTGGFGTDRGENRCDYGLDCIFAGQLRFPGGHDSIERGSG